MVDGSIVMVDRSQIAVRRFVEQKRIDKAVGVDVKNNRQILNELSN